MLDSTECSGWMMLDDSGSASADDVIQFRPLHEMSSGADVSCPSEMLLDYFKPQNWTDRARNRRHIDESNSVLSRSWQVKIAWRKRRPLPPLLLCLFCTIVSCVAWSPSTTSFDTVPATKSLYQFCHKTYMGRRLSRLQLSASKQPSSKSISSLDQTYFDGLKSRLDSLRHTLDARNEEACTLQSLTILRGMLSSYSDWQAPNSNGSTRDISRTNAIIDQAFREATTYAFSTPYNLDKVNLGMAVLKLQLHSEKYVGQSCTFSSVPRGTWLKALRALTSNEINSSRSSSQVLCLSNDNSITAADAAFEILQRLITKRGLRQYDRKQLDERDFNMVLHAYATNNRLNSAHRIIALQERTPHAPPLSPVAYSILLRAYGRNGDGKNVEMSIRHAEQNGVKADIVMANTVLDAYVNCGEIDKAETLFHQLCRDGKTGDDDSGYWPRLRPNLRTYNTMLKGLAIEGRLREALKLSKSMDAINLWDDITTNTLVKVAVTAQDFQVAEHLLANHTTSSTQEHRDHPNIEAYTELIDGYAKDGQLEKALEIMQLMQQRGVSPNEYTYTSMVGALARNNKVRQAKKMIDYVTSSSLLARRGKRVLTPVFNAFISGLLSGDGEDQQQTSRSLNVLEALNALSEMEKLDVYPNVVTVTLLIDGLANCNPPRCKEAKELVQHLEFSLRTKQQQQYKYMMNKPLHRISLANARIGTTLIRAFGRACDVEAATDAFRRITKPDVVALNALLDACCKSSELKLAFEMFEKYAQFNAWKDDELIIENGPLGEKVICRAIHPDVVTYTTLISAVLQLKNKNASKRAAKLYNEMKHVWRISPDTVLVDK